MNQPVAEPISMYQRLLFIYKGAKTKRYHAADTLTSQTVGEHSFGVAWLVVLLCPQARKELILAAMAHDLAEHLVGDVSSPTKRKYPALKTLVDDAEAELLKSHSLDFETQLTKDEMRILKLADNMDGMMFCIRERKMGSRFVCSIYGNFYNYTAELLDSYAPIDAFGLFRDINKAWEKYNVS